MCTFNIFYVGRNQYTAAGGPSSPNPASVFSSVVLSELLLNRCWMAVEGERQGEVGVLVVVQMGATWEWLHT